MGVRKPLHSMNKLRVPLIRDELINKGVINKEVIDTRRPLEGMLILEAGCGEPSARLGSTIIDVSSTLINLANTHAAQDPSLLNLNYLLESVEEHAKSSFEKYDVVVASEVLEHVTEKRIFLEACVKCVKPGGSIFITTENKTAISWLGGIIFAEYITNIVPRGTHNWDKFIAPDDTQKILEDYKCRTRLIHGMYYNFFTNTWFWSGNTDITYALHAVKDKI